MDMGPGQVIKAPVQPVAPSPDQKQPIHPGQPKQGNPRLFIAIACAIWAVGFAAVALVLKMPILYAGTAVGVIAAAMVLATGMSSDKKLQKQAAEHGWEYSRNVKVENVPFELVDRSGLMFRANETPTSEFVDMMKAGSLVMGLYKSLAKDNHVMMYRFFQLPAMHDAGAAVLASKSAPILTKDWLTEHYASAQEPTLGNDLDAYFKVYVPTGYTTPPALSNPAIMEVFMANPKWTFELAGQHVYAYAWWARRSPKEYSEMLQIAADLKRTLEASMGAAALSQTK